MAKNDNKPTIRETLVGKNYEYYKPIFEKFDQDGRQKVWDWKIFIFAPLWYIYRRMPFKGVLLIGIQIVIATICASLKSPIWLGVYLASYLMYVRVGFYGIFDFYMNTKKLEKDYESIGKDKMKEKFLKDKSGPEPFITGCWVIGSAIIYIVAIFF